MGLKARYWSILYMKGSHQFVYKQAWEALSSGYSSENFYKFFIRQYHTQRLFFVVHYYQFCILYIT